ncbi:MAG: hypothetical protein AAGJ18_06695, partial [Bacteroidota bacterium]
DIFEAAFNSYLLDLNVLTFLNKDGIESKLEGVDVTVYEVFDETEQPAQSKGKPEGNSHFFRIKSNKKYRIVAEKPDYFPAELPFDTREPLEGDVITKEIYLKPLRLNVLTFTDEPPKDPLSEVIVRLLEVDDNGVEKLVKLLKTPEGNSYYFPLLSNKKYKLYASKDGYDDVEETFSTSVWTSKSATLTKELILPREEVSIRLRPLKPFSLYFDNDSPVRNQTDTTTDLTFPQTIAAYQNRKAFFKEELTEGLTGAKKSEKLQAVDNFFDLEMDTTYKEFLKFTDAVLRRLEFGRSITVKVQAYASPLASKAYNLKLTKRRISSMINFYRTYRNNAMRQYVDSGALEIELVPHGESKAPKGISDNPRDRQSSVYSLDASRQRKVEIIEVTSNKNGGDPQNGKTSSETLTNK